MRGDAGVNRPSEADSERVWVSYLELLQTPPAPRPHAGTERIARESLSADAYLDLYVKVGTPLRWDRRLKLGRDELDGMLASDRLELYVLRDARGIALGWCEFDRAEFPVIELTHFGLIASAQGRGLGPWLLGVALAAAWHSGARRIWLHTDSWDHPAALRVYERAGFRLFDRRYEAADRL